MPASNLTKLASMRSYVDFDEHSAQLIREFLPMARAFFRAVVDDFYQAIDEHPEARDVITGGQLQVKRLKGTLTDWLESLLSGCYDAEYVERHARIGRVHVRIGLPQHLMFTAMSRVRVQLAMAAEKTFAKQPQKRKQVLVALHQLLDLELALMLDSYREDLMERQRASERLATIGELAASVGHELRNPLGTMESSLYLMQQRLGALGIQDPQLEKHHSKAARQVEQCNDTISRLLDLARDRPPRLEVVPLLDLFEATVQKLDLGASVNVVIDVPASVTAWADPAQLALIIINLIRNSMEAAPNGVTIRLVAEAISGGVCIVLEDDGPGIVEPARSRLFDALFTTRSQGTGLGLALVSRIVRAHHGEITLQPSINGAAFRIWLPEAPAVQESGKLDG